MKTLTAISAALLIGCTPLVTKQEQDVLSYQFVDRVVESCPSTDPLSHRAIVSHVVMQHEQDETPDAMLAELGAACPNLTMQQRVGYGYLLQSAWVQYENDYRTLAKLEKQRRAGKVQDAGRTMMEIQRTDDLNRIRRNQQALY